MSIATDLTTIAENIPKVYEAGKKAEHDEFWDVLLNKGNVVDCRNMFWAWKKDIYKPPYNIVANSSGAAGLFCNCTTIEDIIVDIDVTRGGTCGSMFSWCISLKTIPKIKVSELVTSFNGAFTRCVTNWKI